MRASHKLGLTLALAALTLGGPALAQRQPAEATNSQDEEINLNRAVGADVGDFRVLRSNDKRDILRYVTKAYRLQHANPMEILPYIRAAASLERGSVSTAWLPGADGVNQAWIQVNVPEHMLPYMDQLVPSYDVPGFKSTTGDIKFSYRLKHRRASEVADFIRAATLSGDGSVLGDDATNTIYMSDSPSDFERVLAQIQFYDVPIPQVEVDLLIVELLELDQTKLGLEWDFWKDTIGGGLSFSYESARDALAVAPELAGRARSAGGSLFIGASSLARFLNYLADTSMARTVANTRLNIANGRTGFIRTGTEIPEFDYRLNAGLGASELTETLPPGRTTRTGEGLFVEITPMVAEHSTRLACTVSLRTPAGIDDLNHTIYSTQDLETQLTVDQDQTYPLGVLRRTVTTKQRKGIPLLRDIPVLKYLFSVEKSIGRDTEFFVFATPRWSSPALYDLDGMKGATPMRADSVAGILRDNPNLTINAADQAILDEYMQSR